jgi:hypothetical protein
MARSPRRAAGPADEASGRPVVSAIGAGRLRARSADIARKTAGFGLVLTLSAAAGVLRASVIDWRATRRFARFPQSWRRRGRERPSRAVYPLTRVAPVGVAGAEPSRAVPAVPRRARPCGGRPTRVRREPRRSESVAAVCQERGVRRRKQPDNARSESGAAPITRTAAGRQSSESEPRFRPAGAGHARRGTARRGRQSPTVNNVIGNHSY